MYTNTGYGQVVFVFLCLQINLNAPLSRGHTRVLTHKKYGILLQPFKNYTKICLGKIERVRESWISESIEF